jgi:glycosyltransferase involved in cell wall biosynthesis
MARSRALRACAEEVAEESIDFTRGTPRIRREEGIRRSGRIESDQSKIVATVPCYNEAPFVADIVRQARKHVDQVIVVDDGSQDGTSNAASAAGATLVRHMVNKGYGEAIKTCFQAGRSNGTDIMVTMDGDSQHLPAEIETLVSPILEGEADLVIGSRLLQPGQQMNMPRYRKFGIKAITWLVNVGSRAKVSDAQSGFRAYSREVLEAITLADKGMGVSVEVLIRARRMGFTISEVPVSCRYHDQSSTLNPLSHGLGVALAVIKYRALTAFSSGGTAGKERKGQKGQGTALGQCLGR